MLNLQECVKFLNGIPAGSLHRLSDDQIELKEITDCNRGCAITLLDSESFSNDANANNQKLDDRIVEAMQTMFRLNGNKVLTRAVLKRALGRVKEFAMYDIKWTETGLETELARDIIATIHEEAER